MGCKNGGEFQQEDDERRRSSLVNDALLLTTMCIIGLPVDVHIKDGSVYSGTFHTASVDDHYAIVLKRARMIKKGSFDSNVANEGMIGTLVIRSEDLVQVVAKRVLLPADGFAGHETGDDTGAVLSDFPSNGSPWIEANTTMSKSSVDHLQVCQTRCSSGTENGLANGFRPPHANHSGNALQVNRNADGIDLTKKEVTLNDTDSKRQVEGYRPQGSSQNNGEKIENQKEQITHEVQGSHPSLDTGDRRTPSFLEAVPSGVTATVSSESFVNSSSTLTEPVSSKISNSNRSAKEFKLNPGAKIFSPSFPNQRSATPPAVPMGANLTYIPDNYSALQSEVEISPYAPRSLPIKFVPYGNLLSGNGGGDIQHHPPIVGHMTNRTQPIRYGGQYHPVQTAPTYVQPNSQNVMVGRLGQLVYVHPVSQDMVQSTTGFSQVSTCSLITPHQAHVPKHQGLTQLCVTPQFIAAGGGGQPPFMMPSHAPISQPPYPAMRPMSVPGSNGFLVSKFS